MNYILTEENNRIIDVFECKSELLAWTNEFIKEFNKDMENTGDIENIIEGEAKTVGWCIDQLYGFGYRIHLVSKS